MPYLLQKQITGSIPATFLIEALDDDGDGVADPGLWDSIVQDVQDAIDAILGQRFSVPFIAPIPAIVVAAARVFVLEQLYSRRGIIKDQNPWAAQAGEHRSTLKAIAAGEQPLTPELNRKKPSVSAVTEPSKMATHDGSILA